jgi:hypothetical protein
MVVVHYVNGAIIWQLVLLPATVGLVAAKRVCALCFILPYWVGKMVVAISCSVHT